MMRKLGFKSNVKNRKNPLKKRVKMKKFLIVREKALKRSLLEGAITTQD